MTEKQIWMTPLPCISTGHVDWETANHLELEDEPFCRDWFGDGWLISRYELQDQVSAPSLTAICEWMMANGFDYVRLTQDGDKIADLPFYDW